MEKYKYLIPEESTNMLINNVDTLRKIESKLRKHFAAKDYQEVFMPTFEYLDLYRLIDSNFETEKMFQYINNDGKNIVLRYDYTIPIARYYTHNPDKLGRYCYFGEVYRKQRIHKARSSQIYQGGIELLNQPGLQGDEECISLLETSLELIGFNQIIIELGSAKFFNRLKELVDDTKALTEILRYKKISEMQEFVDQNNFSKELSDLLLVLPTFFGRIDDLKELVTGLTDPILKEAIQELIVDYTFFKDKSQLRFDLSMVPSMGYYTGLMVKAYAKTSPIPIVTGGRYDKLLPQFNNSASAIGFSFNLNSVLDAKELEAEEND